MPDAIVHLKCRPLPGQLRYCASKLRDGMNPGVVALVLETIADLLEEDGMCPCGKPITHIEFCYGGDVVPP